MTKLTSTQKNEIVSRYSAGQNSVSLGRAYGISDWRVRRIIRLGGGTIRSHQKIMTKLTSTQRAEIISNYSANQSSVSLGRAYGISEWSVLHIIRLGGGTIRSRSEANRTRSYNDKAFDVINPHSAYWAGFLTADGYVRGNILSLLLSERDEDHVKKFRDFLDSNHIIGHLTDKRGGACKRIEITSQTLIEGVAKLGVTQGKLKRIAPPTLSNDPHFWRGVIDGDGSIYLDKGRNVANKARLQLVGSAPLLEQFLLFVKSIYPTTEATVHPRSSIYGVTLTGVAAFNIIDALYSDAPIALERKHDMAKNILSRGLQRTRGLRIINTPNGLILLCEAAKLSRISQGTLRYRIAAGWPTANLFDSPEHRTRHFSPHCDNQSRV